MSKNVTIQDVAQLAGVSMMTVSRVLNNTSNVKAATKEKIERAVSLLGYTPNFSARRLSGGRNYFLGVLCYQPNSAYVSQFLFGCMRYCSQVGYHLIVEESHGNQNIIATIQALVNDVDGIILLPPVSENPQVLAELDKHNIPYIQVGQQLDTDAGPMISSVAINDYLAAFEVTEYLIAQGHSDIGFITGDKQQQVSQLRLNGYKDALLKHGLALNKNLVQEGDFTYKSALDATEKLFKGKPKPTAIFASNDDMAAAVIAVAHKHNSKVPDDLSVVGFDDASTATMVWPQLTTVRQPLQEMAVKAIDRLLGRHKNANIHLPFEIVYRDSVKKLTR